MREVIPGRLWIGNAGDARDPAKVLGADVAAMVNLAAEELPPTLPRDILYCHKCHSRGNQLELWAAANKLSLYDAALDLCRVLGREVPWIERW